MLNRLSLIAGLFVLAACESSPPLNPNGDSPLALTMRAMRDDLQAWRERAAAGALDPSTVAARLDAHRAILTAEPSKGHVRDAFFEEMSVAYVEQVEALARQPDREHYNSTVAICQGCHNQTCRGPLVVIDRMPIGE